MNCFSYISAPFLQNLAKISFNRMKWLHYLEVLGSFNVCKLFDVFWNVLCFEGIKVVEWGGGGGIMQTWKILNLKVIQNQNLK